MFVTEKKTGEIVVRTVETEDINPGFDPYSAIK
jgi:hypothetical protein